MGYDKGYGKSASGESKGGCGKDMWDGYSKGKAEGKGCSDWSGKGESWDGWGAPKGYAGGPSAASAWGSEAAKGYGKAPGQDASGWEGFAKGGKAPEASGWEGFAKGGKAPEASGW